jgi:hypothetical protein
VSHYKKSSAALRKTEEESLPPRRAEQTAQIIPWPNVRKIARKPGEKKSVRLEGKYLYYQGKKISILHFQKAGYDKLLKLLVKEIG